MKRNIASIIFAALVFFCATTAFTQEQPTTTSTPNFMDRIVIGGDIGLQFGTITMIDLSPIIGYKFTDRFIAGVGITYRYYRYRDILYNQVYQTSIYGGSVFARYYVLRNLFLHIEYEALSLETAVFDLNTPPTHSGTRFWIGSPLAGAGYRQPISGRASFNIMILFDLNETIYSQNIYQNPIIRAGVTLGI